MALTTARLALLGSLLLYALAFLVGMASPEFGLLTSMIAVVGIALSALANVILQIARWVGGMGKSRWGN